MKFLLIRLFLDAAAGEGGAGGNGGSGEGGGQGEGGNNGNAELEKLKADNAALTTKFTELETKFAALSSKKDEGKGDEGKTGGKKKDEEVPEYVKKQNELLEKALNQIASFQTEKTTGTRRTLLETELKAVDGLPEDYRNEVIDNFNGRTFENDAAFETFKKSKIEVAKKVAQDLSAKEISIFGPPQKGANGSDGNNLSAVEQEYLKQKFPSKN